MTLDFEDETDAIDAIYFAVKSFTHVDDCAELSDINPAQHSSNTNFASLQKKIKFYQNFAHNQQEKINRRAR